MSKKVQKRFRMHMLAWKATPAPPVWPTLWQYGLNIWLVVKEVNDKTRDLMTKYAWVDVKVPVEFKVYADRSYDLEILPPLSSHLILWKAKLKAGSWEPNKKKVWKITKSELSELIELKRWVMNTQSDESILKSLIWTAKSLGIEVIE